MPKVKVLFYAEEDGSAPVDRWLEKLPKKVQAKGDLKIAVKRKNLYLNNPNKHTYQKAI